jgi:hypothetical protein
MLGQISILTLQEGNTLSTIPTRWSISGWRVDDHDLHKNNKTQYFIIDKIQIICNYKSWFIHHLIIQLKCCCEQRRNVIWFIAIYLFTQDINVDRSVEIHKCSACPQASYLKQVTCWHRIILTCFFLKNIWYSSVMVDISCKDCL